MSKKLTVEELFVPGNKLRVKCRILSDLIQNKIVHKVDIIEVTQSVPREDYIKEHYDRLCDWFELVEPAASKPKPQEEFKSYQIVIKDILKEDSMLELFVPDNEFEVIRDTGSYLKNAKDGVSLSYPKGHRFVVTESFPDMKWFKSWFGGTELDKWFKFIGKKEEKKKEIEMIDLFVPGNKFEVLTEGGLQVRGKSGSYHHFNKGDILTVSDLLPDLKWLQSHSNNGMLIKNFKLVVEEKEPEYVRPWKVGTVLEVLPEYTTFSEDPPEHKSNNRVYYKGQRFTVTENFPHPVWCKHYESLNVANWFQVVEERKVDNRPWKVGTKLKVAKYDLCINSQEITAIYPKTHQVGEVITVTEDLPSKEWCDYWKVNRTGFTEWFTVVEEPKQEEKKVEEKQLPRFKEGSKVMFAGKEWFIGNWTSDPCATKGYYLSSVPYPNNITYPGNCFLNYNITHQLCTSVFEFKVGQVFQDADKDIWLITQVYTNYISIHNGLKNWCPAPGELAQQVNEGKFKLIHDNNK